MPTVPGSDQILHFPLDHLSRSYSHFSRLLRVLRGLSASSIISVLIAIFFPFVVYVFFAVGQNFAFFVLGLFFDVAQESILPPEDLLEWLNIVYYSKIGLFLWLCFILPLSVLAFYFSFFYYQKISRFSLLTASIIFLWIAASIVAMPVLVVFPFLLSEPSEFVKEPSLYWMSAVFGIIITVPVFWLLMRGIVVILRQSGTPAKFLMPLRGSSPSFFLGLRRLAEELYRSVGVVFPPTSSKVNIKVVSACLFAIICEGFAYGTYINFGASWAKIAIEHAGPEAADIGIKWSISGISTLMAFKLVSSLIMVRFSFFISRRLRKYAQHRSVVLANEARDRDSRPPVLFLRTFRDDQVSLKEVRTSKFVRFFEPNAVVKTIEQLVVKNLTPYGPVIALGNPADMQPPIGASRDYVREEDWQEVVEDLMENSVRIVISLDFSPNLQWEVETIRNRKWLHKTITLIPPRLSSNREDLDRIFKLLKIREANKQLNQLESKSTTENDAVRPHPLARLSSSNRNFIGVVWQNENCPILMTSDRLSELEYELALRVCVQLDHINKAECSTTDSFRNILLSELKSSWKLNKRNWIFGISCLLLAGVILTNMFITSKEQQIGQQQEKAEAVYHLGEAYLRQGKFSSALKEFLKAEAIIPDDYALQKDLGLAYYYLREQDQAIKHFKKALALKDDYAPARNALGNAYADKKDWDKAIEQYKIVSSDPLYKTPEFPLSNLGFAYYQKKEYRLSEKYFKKALKSKPDFVNALYGLAKTYMATGRVSEAIVRLEKTAKISPKSAIVYFEMAKAYLLKNDYRKAYEAFIRVTQIDPDSPLADQALREAKMIKPLL